MNLESLLFYKMVQGILMVTIVWYAILILFVGFAAVVCITTLIDFAKLVFSECIQFCVLIVVLIGYKYTNVITLISCYLKLFLFDYCTLVCCITCGIYILVVVVTRLQQEEPRSLIFCIACVDNVNIILILFILLIIHLHVLISKAFKFYVLMISFSIQS